MVLVIMFLLSMVGCGLISPHVDEFTFEREVYLGDDIRLDGYFVHQGNVTESMQIIFFNRNGITLHFGHAKSIEELEFSIRNNKYPFNSRGLWGIYKVEESLITHETWKAGSGFHRAGFKYAIVSDTVIAVSEIYGQEYGKKVGDVYHFRQFSPKPDSVSQYIE